MKFKLENLPQRLNVTHIANVHFFKFSNVFFTRDDCHPLYELVFVSTNMLEIDSFEYKGLLHKNEMIIHKPDEKHSHSCPNRSSDIIIIDFACDAEELKSFTAEPVKCNEAEIQKLVEIIREARNVFAPPYDVPTNNMRKKKNPPFCGEQMLQLLLESFLIGLIRRYTAQKELSPNSHPALSIQNIVDYLDANFLEKITLDELAFIFCTNRSTLCHDFKQATGKTPIKYVNDKKLEIAKDKILNTNVSLTEIAEVLHFNTIHTFSRFFKQQTGLPPKEFRSKTKAPH